MGDPLIDAFSHIADQVLLSNQKENPSFNSEEMVFCIGTLYNIKDPTTYRGIEVRIYEDLGFSVVLLNRRDLDSPACATT